MQTVGEFLKNNCTCASHVDNMAAGVAHCVQARWNLAVQIEYRKMIITTTEQNLSLRNVKTRNISLPLTMG